MIIDCISDLHGFYPKLEGGDLLIIGGDLTARDTEKEHIQFSIWLEEQPYRNIVFIAGNHDNYYEKYYKYTVDPTISYLCDSGTEFEGLKIWGTPWSLTFPGINPKCTAFTGTEEELKEKYDLIPDDIDILISHGPPYCILDKTINVEYVGSKSLREALEIIKPKLFLCGHIHEQGGKELLLKGQMGDPNTICVNASYVDERYRPANKVMRIEL